MNTQLTSLKTLMIVENLASLRGICDEMPADECKDLLLEFITRADESQKVKEPEFLDIAKSRKVTIGHEIAIGQEPGMELTWAAPSRYDQFLSGPGGASRKIATKEKAPELPGLGSTRGGYRKELTPIHKTRTTGFYKDGTPVADPKLTAVNPLRVLRVAKGLRIKDLARKITISAPQIGKLEQGRVALTPEIAIQIGQVFKLDAQDFFDNWPGMKRE